MQKNPKRQLDTGNPNFFSPVNSALGNKEAKDALEKAVFDPNVGVKGFVFGTLKLGGPVTKPVIEMPALQLQNAQIKPDIKQMKLTVSDELLAKKGKILPITLLQK